MATAIDADIRLLTVDDLDGALKLSSTAGWNQRLADWRMLLQLAPAGSFAAVIDGRIIGTAIGIDYGPFGWIAMMLVDPAYRGHGLGARLLEAAMGVISPDHPIRLDATPLGRPLYQRYGFEDESMLTRHVADPSRQVQVDAPALAARRVRELTAADLAGVTAVDHKVFGANRRVLLEWALDGATDYAHVIEAAAGPHYCFGRPGRLFEQIGPVVAGSDDDAKALVTAALIAAEGKAVVLDAFDAHAPFSEWLRTRGFSGVRPLFRMCRPGTHRTAAADPANRGELVEYAILGPEFA